MKEWYASCDTHRELFSLSFFDRQRSMLDVNATVLFCHSISQVSTPNDLLAYEKTVNAEPLSWDLPK